MMRSLLAAAYALFLASPAVACLESPESVHQREVYILSQGIQTSKRDARVVAKAKELSDLAESAFKAGKYQDAMDYRRSALIAIGYKLETARSEDGQTPPKPPLADSATAALRGCGDDAVWTPPAD